MNRYFDLVQQNREIQNRTLEYQSLQDSYINSMITSLQYQNNRMNRSSVRQRANYNSPSIRTAFFDLGTIFNDVVVRPTRQQITDATNEIVFNNIVNPQNTRCPISQQDFSENDTVTQIRHCGHIFYPNEINTWWQRNVRCPVCRYDIRDYQATTDRTRVRTEIPENRQADNEISDNELSDNEPTIETNQNIELNNNTNHSDRTRRTGTINYNNQTTIPRIRTIPITSTPITSAPRTNVSRNFRTMQNNSISDQELTSYVTLATQLLNNFTQRDLSGEIDILYTIE